MDLGWSRATRIGLGVFVALAMVAGFLVMTVVGRSSVAAAAAPMYLEAVNQPGNNPFVPVAAKASAPAPGGAQPTEESADPAEPAESDDSAGSDELGKCDPEQLIAYLTTHQDAAQAWIDALNSDPNLTWSGGDEVTLEDIPDYIAQLTTVTLPEDRRVTNYQFENGTAVAVQSVLQANTAVLVDAAGVPRVRCACGNPLTPMKQITAPPTYLGTPWSGFTPVVVIVVVERDPQCDDDEYYDGDRCRPYVECPPPQYLGMDGRCYYEVDDCPDGWLRDDDGHCYDPYPDYCPGGYAKRPGVDCVEPPVCPDGSPRDRGDPCEPPDVCPDGSMKHSGEECPKPPVCPEGSDASTGDRGECPKPPVCPDGSEQERGKPCTPDPSCDEQFRPGCPPKDTCPDGSVRKQGEECSEPPSPPSCQDGSPRSDSEDCAVVQPPQLPQPKTCEDGSAVPESGECAVVPSPLPKTCLDGSQAPEGGDCPGVQPPLQKTCLDGSAAPEGAECPVAPPQQQPKTCPDGSAAPASGDCPVKALPSRKPCPDGSAAPESGKCPVKKTPTSTACPDGSVAPAGETCPVKTKTPPPRTSCPPGMFLSDGLCFTCLGPSPDRVPPEGCAPTASGRRGSRTSSGRRRGA
ncbi:DUF6777 domain-containing protein [Pseudonocardia sp. TRM90224]|uniref:DUF6777 domain-containing protein n=1 Tax=Pseudonocardia sp. TRM90224 TaxID=2812678 RepID=UPI001E38EAFC|nr:DUF6777 domain-containing protein [Pseudonocardia sp. TRM90224]